MQNSVDPNDLQDLDSGDWTAEQDLWLLAESGRLAGWDDPSMDVYDDYDANRGR